MKEEFNTAKPVEFTDVDGATLHIYRADIDSIKPAPKSSPANTIVTLKKGEAYSDGGTLSLREDIRKVVDVLNGAPDEETVKAWEDEILEKRVGQIRKDIDVISSQKDVALEQEKRGYQRSLDELKQVKAVAQASLRASQRIVDQARYVKLASALRDYADSLPQTSWRNAVLSSLAYKIGGNGLAHADYIARYNASRDTMPETIANVEADRDMALTRLQRKYDTRIDSLKAQAEEPQMTFEDKKLLDDKMREHRVAQTGVPAFFVSAPDGESFRPKTDVDRENALAMMERLRRRAAPKDDGRDGLELELRKGRPRDGGFER